MNTSIDNFSFNISGDLKIDTSTSYNRAIELSESNISELYKIFAFSNLPNNWDSYGGKKPSNAAIVKASNFIVKELNSRNIDVFFSAPTPDGDILVELKNDKANLEFIFSGDVNDIIVASDNGDFHVEEVLNETTQYAYLKWLYV